MNRGVRAVFPRPVAGPPGGSNAAPSVRERAYQLLAPLRIERRLAARPSRPRTMM